MKKFPDTGKFLEALRDKQSSATFEELPKHMDSRKDQGISHVQCSSTSEGSL